MTPQPSHKGRRGHHFHTTKPPRETLEQWDNHRLLQETRSALAPLLPESELLQVEQRALSLLERGVHEEGIRQMLYQIVRNRDPEMKHNHVIELQLAHHFSARPGRVLEVERMASGRNSKRVDFGLDDTDESFLVELKNLNAPLIKRVEDPASEALRKDLRPPDRTRDLHLVYLFFKRPRNHEYGALARNLEAMWAGLGPLQDAEIHYWPPQRPMVAAIFTPARPDTGGRVIVYDHGDHLATQPGLRVRAPDHATPHHRTGRDLVEELFVKDNILRRVHDTENKFPLDPLHDEETSAAEARPCFRILAFYLGDWAPYQRIEGYLRDVLHWYQHQTAASDDFVGSYYAVWARQNAFEALGNIDTVLALQGKADEAPFQSECLYSQTRDAYKRLWRS